MKRFFDSRGTALNCISATLQNAQLIRIATAYFEPSGYQCLQDVLARKQILLLVGREEGGRDKAELVIRKFVNELAAHPIDRRIRAMRLMLEALENHQLFIGVSASLHDSTFLDARYLYHHAKLYIADEDAAVVTSANMSYHGLVVSREAGYVVENPDDVSYFAQRFDKYFEHAESITQPLIDELKAYLDAHRPFDVYIRALIELYRLPDETVPRELPPLAAYQQPVVSRVLQALQDYRGALLIASTGLGKTVMAAHLVAYLRMEGLIDRVIIISPAGLRDQWNRYMWMAATSSREFSYSNLSGNINQITTRILDHELRHISSTTLIILDESHHMRNKDATDGENKLRYSRVYNAVRRRHAQLLMLTATPFSRNIDDVNAQLGLLPLSEFATLSLDSHKPIKWEVQQTNELSDLPPCAVLTTPSVVYHFSFDDENGEKYVVFGKDDKRYFPRRLKFRTETYINPLDDLLVELLNSGLLNQEAPEQAYLWGEDEMAGQRTGFFNAETMKQFCSSPVQVESRFEKLAQPNGFENMRFAHQKELTHFVRVSMPFIRKFQSPENDSKLRRVIEIIQQARMDGRKVIIFCHYLETARYVTQCINEATILGTMAETTADRSPDMVDRIIKRFAPIANELEELDGEEPIQVLVATGALVEGFNLQDASVLINYDLSWTVLTLAQRLGRILRPWHEPREIHIYNFIPSTMHDPRIPMAQNWHQRLQDRNRQHQSLADIPVLLDDKDANEDEMEMQSLARHFQIFNQETSLDLDQTLDFIRGAQKLDTSSFWDDLVSIAPGEKLHVMKLPPGFRSARTLSGKTRLFILFKYQRRYYPALFDAKARLVMDSERRDAIMETIRCSPTDPVAPFDMYPEDDQFDGWIAAARQSWAESREISVVEVHIVCALALVGNS